MSKHGQVISVSSVVSIDHCYRSIGYCSTHPEVSGGTDQSHPDNQRWYWINRYPLTVMGGSIHGLDVLPNTNFKWGESYTNHIVDGLAGIRTLQITLDKWLKWSHPFWPLCWLVQILISFTFLCLEHLSHRAKYMNQDHQISGALDWDSVLHANLLVAPLRFTSCSSKTLLMLPRLHLHAEMKAPLA